MISEWISGGEAGEICMRGRGWWWYRERIAHGDGGVGRRHGDGRRCRDLSRLVWSGRGRARRRRRAVPPLGGEGEGEI